MKPPKPESIHERKGHPILVHGPASDNGCKWTELPAESLLAPSDTRLRCREDDTVFLKLILPAILQPEPEFSVSNSNPNPALESRGQFPNTGSRGLFAWSGSHTMKPNTHIPNVTDDDAAQFTAWALLIGALVAPVPFATEASHWAWLLPTVWVALLAWVWSRSR